MNEVIKCYVRHVNSGRMTLEEVPERYREKVKEILYGESNNDK